MFSPIQVGSLTLKNRLIKSAATSMVSDDEQKAVAYHGRIAAGGMGAVLIEGSYDMLARLDKRTVSAAGQSSGRLTIEESPLQAICAEVHSHDCPCLIQMKTATPGIVYQWENMGPEGETHKASLLSAADIQMYIEDTIDGAARLQAIGFDVTVPCDCVIDASDMLPDTALADELGSEFDVYTVGDCETPLNIANAISTANLAARHC